MHYLPRDGSDNNRFQNNLLQIQFYHVLRSLGMGNQVETQKRYQRTSIQQNSMHYLPIGGGGGGGSESNRFQFNFLQIQLYDVLYIHWDAQSSRHTKRKDFNSAKF